MEENSISDKEKMRDYAEKCEEKDDERIMNEKEILREKYMIEMKQIQNDVMAKKEDLKMKEIYKLNNKNYVKGEKDRLEKGEMKIRVGKKEEIDQIGDKILDTKEDAHGDREIKDKRTVRDSKDLKTKIKMEIGRRFRGNSSPDSLDTVKSKSGSSEPSKPKSESDKTVVNTIARGELDIPGDILSRFTVENLDTLVKPGSIKPHRKSLRQWLIGTHPGEEDLVSTSKFYVNVDDEQGNDMVTTTSEAGNDNTTMQDKKKKVRPEGTVEYIIQETDTLEKIAAKNDTTPSELKKLNRLVTSMIFSGQTIFVPDKDYVLAHTSTPVSPKTKEPSVSETTSPPTSAKDNRPQMDIPLVKASNSSPERVPGRAERQTPVSSPKDAFDFEIIPPHKLSEDEVQQLDQDCMARFIKLNVKHITDGQGVVRGVLLVTPNAVMFDPDVSDPLVVERGADKYGMIAPMDLIISAAMYHDIAAMKLRGQKMDDGTVYPKPEVYHDTTCPLAKERIENSQRLDQADGPLSKGLKKVLSKPLTKTDSVCSCGQGGLEADLRVTGETGEKSPSDIEDVTDEFNKSRTDETIPDESTDSDNNKVIDKDEPDVFSEETAKAVEEDASDLPEKAKSSNTQKGVKKLTVSFSIPDSEDQGASDVAGDASDVTDSVAPTENNATATKNISDSEKDKQTDDSENDTDKTDNQQGKDTVDKSDKDHELDSATGEQTVDSPNDDNVETRIGNIMYMPVVEDSNGQVNLKALEKTQNTLSKISESEFGEISKSDTNLAAISDREEEKPRSSSTSSLGPFSPTPHLSAFVNYATGFFQRHASDNSIKDIKDLILDSAPLVNRSSDLPVISAAPVNAGRPKGKMSRHENTGHEVEVENAVAMDEKADLMTMDYDRFKPRQSIAYPDPPLYLCLKLGHPTNKNVFHNYSIESYGRRRKKSEYWFSIPREKVDHLYAFFVQWTPEIYGDEEDLTAEKRGFVVIEDGDEEADELEMLDEHFGPNSSFQKDWEIISKHEAMKRRSIVFDVPIPLPELVGESAILTEEHIIELNQFLPGRTVGYPWTLMYSTDKHGFSLKTLYRDMQGLDSPILLVVKDTYDNVFGALSSCEIKISESFYGTGETFLYSFYPSFQVFNWTGENNFFIKGDQHSLCIGAGQGVNGLWLDEDLYHGRTNKCETFGNDILTVSEDFVLKAFEAWAFIFD